MSERDSSETTRTSIAKRIAHTPLRDLLRGSLTARLDVRGRIERTDMPEAARALIHRVVHRTRLWRREKVDVADELIAHFQDGVEAGGTVDELITDFGDEAKVAKLIRRAKKRQRPLPWRTLMRTFQITAVVILIYGLLIGWYVTGEPDVSTNYLAKLNAPAGAVPEEERAWPLYRKALIDHGHRPLEVASELYTGFEDDQLPRPSDPKWDEFTQFMHKQRDLLADIRSGARKSGLGFPAARFSQAAYSEQNQRALFGQTRSATHAPTDNAKTSWKSQPLMGVLLPHHGVMRRMAQITAADMHLAAQEGDAARVIADFETMVGLARQTRELPILISQLVAHSILELACARLNEALAEDPGMFNRPQLVKLAHTLAKMNELEALQWEGERMVMYDAFQRFYDESGNITDEGLRFFQRKTPYVVTVASLPWSNLLIADRDEMAAQYERLLAMIQRYGDRPLWEQLRTDSEVQQVVERWRASPWLTARYLPLLITFPAMDQAAISARRITAHREALQVAIALELHHRDHGAYPDDPSALVPQYLPEPPVDHSTGEPLLLKVTNGQPVLYGRGLDGDDDGGAMPDDPRYPAVPRRGDWMLYPMPSASDE